MKKEVAINILEELQDELNSADWKEKTLNTINLCRRKLEIEESSKLKRTDR